MMHNILITGGAGYIGSHMALHLTASGMTPVILDNLTTGSRALVPDQAIFYHGDVGNQELTRSIIAEHQITSIIHFAASVVVPESVSDPLKYYLNNTAQTSLLLQTAIASGIRYFLFSSTAAVYGIPAHSKISEDTPLNPINPYGTSKMMSEMILQDTARAHGLVFGILRYFNVAGADAMMRAGQMSKQATHLIKVACQAACGKRDHVEIFGTDFDTADKTGVRDYIHVSDLARIHHETLTLMQQSGQSQLFNCGYGHGYSVCAVLDAVDALNAEQGRPPLMRIESQRRAGDPASLIANNAKLYNTLTFEPQHDDLLAIIASALAWEQTL